MDSKPINVIMFSGGIESTTLAAESRRKKDNSRYLFCNLRPVVRPRDQDAVERLSSSLDINVETFDLSTLTQVQRNAARYGATPEVAGEKTDWGHDGWWARSPSTFLLGLSSALFYAQLVGAEKVSVGLLKTQVGELPKLQEHFAAIQAFGHYINPQSKPIGIHVPFAELEKRHVVKRALDAGVRLHETWSCLRDGDLHCGECYACKERASAIHAVIGSDPTQYAVQPSP